MDKILSQLESPEQLRSMDNASLVQLAEEIRDTLCNLLSQRAAHFASNLGVVELCLALHTAFDFSSDRLLWDTGHQIYPHKLITGRYHEFGSIRTRGGLMGYPNPKESPYDLFMTGHAGSSISTMLGLRSGDALLRPDEGRHAVAVIGDGAFPSGIVYEAMNNAGGMREKLLVVLNDNRMSICPRVGGLADMLDRMRITRSYSGLKTGLAGVLDRVPLVGVPLERFLGNFKEAIKAGLHGGMLFEELGFRYVGPIDGHHIPQLRKYFEMVKNLEGPVLLHVVTEKGHGFRPAAENPVYFHTPAPFTLEEEGWLPVKNSSSTSYTHLAADAIEKALDRRSDVTVLTAAMCQGNRLESVRDRFPKRFFDTGICEGHAVAFAAGQAKAGLRPIVDIYSTFLQRSYDQIFQEVALQNLPVTFMLDRAGLTGPDGPTHHGVFDIGYMRLFPQMTVMAPGDGEDLSAMLDFALQHDGPVSIRYPKTAATCLGREGVIADRAPIELGKAEVVASGSDGTILCCGTLLGEACEARRGLQERGLDVGVVNARFVKPLDRALIEKVAGESQFLVTVEEGALGGGFGSAVLECLNDLGMGSRLLRLGIPDRFIEHGDREELLADLGLDAAGILKACVDLAGQCGIGHAKLAEQAS
ncbi:MAG: 1-deoxy-D-xylulose-5-phosphate synthase [Planctomycetota bacterium]|nr:1-deoxy-D-xylulose-5-phosphate synthase [Planctomycetota bacterium]